MSTSNLKVSVAALLLFVSAAAIYISLPNVTVAVSGSGTTEAVPLVIFTVSTVIALISVAGLVKLAVSRACGKKKIDLSGEESGHTASQVSQEESVEQDSRSQADVDRAIPQNNNASSPSTSGEAPPPPPPPVMLGAQPNTSASVPPPPPSSNGTLLPKEANSPSMSKARGDMLAQIRARGGFKLKNDNNSKER